MHEAGRELSILRSWVLLTFSLCYCIGKKISEKVKRIMGPSTPHIGYNPESASLSNIQQKGTSTIPRRHGRKSKYQLALEKCGGSAKRGRSCATSFQKRL